MPLVLILSSFVAASRVGGGAQALALMPFKIDAVVVPSVLFGRHPGWGPPGGGPVAVETMADMVEGIAANGLLALVDAVITGYFVNPEQIAFAAETVDRVRAARPTARIVVDPVLGDMGRGFFVSPEVCEAMARELVPRADVVTPNLFELEYLAGREARTIAAAVAAARTLKPSVLVTSAPIGGDETGALYVDPTTAVLAAHRRLARAPQGTGDLICALFTAGLIEGLTPNLALARATRGMTETLEAAEVWNAPELPIVALGDRLVRPTAEVRIETFA